MLWDDLKKKQDIAKNDFFFHFITSNELNYETKKIKNIYDQSKQNHE